MLKNTLKNRLQNYAENVNFQLYYFGLVYFMEALLSAQECLAHNYVNVIFRHLLPPNGIIWYQTCLVCNCNTRSYTTDKHEHLFYNQFDYG